MASDPHNLQAITCRHCGAVIARLAPVSLVTRTELKCPRCERVKVLQITIQRVLDRQSAKV